MILTLFYYIILFAVTSIVGAYCLKLLKVVEPNIFYHAIFGTGVLCFFGLLFFITGPINFSASITILILAVVLLWFKPQVGIQILISLKVWFKQLRKPDIFYIVLLSIPIIYQSAQASKIHDDGMYYQQTILWAKQFGLTKGLANLHPALGLFSTWHLFTALFDPSNFGQEPFHHYNGFLLLVACLYFFNEFKLNKSVFAFAILLLLPVLGFMFLTAPNTDLPLIIFSSILFYRVIVKEITTFDAFFLAIIAFSIKPPALLGVFLAIFIVIKNFNKRRIINYCSIGILLVTPLVYKNAVLSGYLFYPSALANVLQAEWKVPEEVNKFYRTGVVSWGISDSFKFKEINAYGNLNMAKRMEVWFNREGYKGLFNKILFAFFIGALIFIIITLIKHPKIKYWQILLLGLLLVLFLEWLALSQYRLLLQTILVLMSYVIYLGFKQISRLYFAIFLVVSVLWCLAFVPLTILKNTSRNKSITAFNGFNSKYLIYPFSQFSLGEPTITDTLNLKLNYFPNAAYCWHCPLPCQSLGQQKFLLQNFGYKVMPLNQPKSMGFKMIRIIETDF